MKITTQLLKFGIIGILSTIIHLLVFSYFVLVHEISTVISNILAFFFAVIFSFYGHYKVTFHSQLVVAAPEIKLLKRLPRFFLSAITGLLSNIIIAFIIVDILHLKFIYAIILMGVLTPMYLFIINKFWVFK